MPERTTLGVILSGLLIISGRTKLITEITDNDVAKLVAWRRGHRVVRSKKHNRELAPLITNATVNRSTTEVRKNYLRGAKAWGAKFEHEPAWKKHILKEPQERVRELVGDEGERLEMGTRADYAPFLSFARASGLRLRECLLRWTEVNWQAGQIQKLGKGGKLVTVPITPTIRTILWPLQGHDANHVFYLHRKANTRGSRKRASLSLHLFGGQNLLASLAKTGPALSIFAFMISGTI